MDWKNIILDYEFYLKIERGLSENTVKNYSLDIEALTKFIIENNIEEGPADCSKATLQEFIYKFSKGWLILSSQKTLKKVQKTVPKKHFKNSFINIQSLSVQIVRLGEYQL